VTKPAGKGSPHLDQGQQAQAEEHAAPEALVIHEVVREDGENELKKSFSAVSWSGLSAGLSMGFSFLGLALFRGLLPDEPWSRIIFSVGYTIGFSITILGRQELFTESTLTAMLPLLVTRDLKTLLSVLRFWAIVLVANLIGTALFALLLSVNGLFPESTTRALAETAADGAFLPLLPGFVKAIFAGWLIALMAWMLPSAKSARLFVILLLTYVVALGGFPHVVAGSVEAAYAVIQHTASVSDYLFKFFLPTVAGNTIGGVALVALLNHAPLSSDLQNGNSKPGSSWEQAGSTRTAPSTQRRKTRRKDLGV
jgi:formate/nitrite transporter FocA (FNT family)